jgi:hypothetical protein
MNGRERRLHLIASRRRVPVSLQAKEDPVDIRFISALTGDDEDRFAPVLLKAMADLLNKIPITYLVRIETSRGTIFQRSHSGPRPPSSTVTRSEGPHLRH